MPFVLGESSRHYVGSDGMCDSVCMSFLGVSRYL